MVRRTQSDSNQQIRMNLGVKLIRTILGVKLIFWICLGIHIYFIHFIHMSVARPHVDLPKLILNINTEQEKKQTDDTLISGELQ